MDRRSEQKVARGVAWAGSAKWGGQLLSFGIYTGLARLLSPQVFGLVAIGGIYIAFMLVFVNQGFGTAIVQRQDLEREHLNSAFWITGAMASCLSLLSILLGGAIARLFHEPRVAPVIGWLSLSFLLYALSSVPAALLTRERDFLALSIRSLIATAAGGVVGLTMAYIGCGVWSLVGQQLMNSTIGCVCLWSAVPWRPSFRISRRHLRDLYGFSLKVTGYDVLWFFSRNSDQTLVGYGFGSLGLGPYSLASRLISFVHDGVVGPLQSVALPAFSKLQSEPLRLERALYRFCEMSSFVSLPMFAGIFIIAPEFVKLLFGAKWIAAVPVLQVLSIYGFIRVVLGFSYPFLLAKGRPGFYLLSNAVLAVLTFGGCAACVRWSPEAIGASLAISIMLFALIFVPVASKVADFRVRLFMKSFLFPGLSSLFMLVVLALVRKVMIGNLTPLSTLATCVAVGAVVYVSTAFLVRPDLVKEIWLMLGHSLFSPKVASADTSSSAQSEYLKEAVTEPSEP